jgi:hypothetical protein
MAGKKPAKRNITNNQKEIKIDLPGKALKYIGNKDKPFICPTCAKSLVRGIIWEDSSLSYCSRICIPKKQEAIA